MQMLLWSETAILSCSKNWAMNGSNIQYCIPLGNVPASPPGVEGPEIDLTSGITLSTGMAKRAALCLAVWGRSASPINLCSPTVSWTVYLALISSFVQSRMAGLNSKFAGSRNKNSGFAPFRVANSKSSWKKSSFVSSRQKRAWNALTHMYSLNF